MSRPWYNLGRMEISDLEFIRRLAMLDVTATLDSMVGLLLAEEDGDQEVALLRSITALAIERNGYQREITEIVVESCAKKVEAIPNFRMSELFYLITCKALNNDMVLVSDGHQEPPIVKMADSLGYDAVTLQQALKRVRDQVNQAVLLPQRTAEAAAPPPEEDFINMQGPKTDQ